MIGPVLCNVVYLGVKLVAYGMFFFRPVASPSIIISHLAITQEHVLKADKKIME